MRKTILSFQCLRHATLFPVMFVNERSEQICGSEQAADTNNGLILRLNLQICDIRKPKLFHEVDKVNTQKVDIQKEKRRQTAPFLYNNFEDTPLPGPHWAFLSHAVASATEVEAEAYISHSLYVSIIHVGIGQCLIPCSHHQRVAGGKELSAVFQATTIGEA